MSVIVGGGSITLMYVSSAFCKAQMLLALITYTYKRMCQTKPATLRSTLPVFRCIKQAYVSCVGFAVAAPFSTPKQACALVPLPDRPCTGCVFHY